MKTILPSDIQSKPKSGLVGIKYVTRNSQVSAEQSNPKERVEGAKEPEVQSSTNTGVEDVQDPTINIQPSSVETHPTNSLVEGAMDSDVAISSGTSSQDPKTLTVEKSPFLILIATNLETVSRFANSTVLSAQEVMEAASHHLKFLIQLCKTNDVDFDEIVRTELTLGESLESEELENQQTVGNTDDLAMDVVSALETDNIAEDSLESEELKNQQSVGNTDEAMDAVSALETDIASVAEAVILFPIDRKRFSSDDEIIHSKFSLISNSSEFDNRLFDSKIRIITPDRTADWLFSCVLSMFVHALRIHIMTTSLLDFDRSTHELVYNFLSDTPRLDSAWLVLGLGNPLQYNGSRRLTFIIDFLLGNCFRAADIQLNYLQSCTVVMRSTSNSVSSADSIDFNRMIATKILESLSTNSSQHTLDLSLIFIDIVTPTAAAAADSSAKYLSFPNRIMIKYPVTSVVYQSVAALYKCTISGEDRYMFRIVTRHCRNFGTSYVTLDLPYDGQYNQTTSEYNFEKFDTLKGKRSFPPVIKRNKCVWLLDGIILSLNSGQFIRQTEYSEYACSVKSTKKNIVSEDQMICELLYSLSDSEIVGSYNGKFHICIEDMKILTSGTGWYTDEIMNVAMNRIISFFPSGSGVVADVSVFRELLQACLADNNANTSPTAVNDAYENSKTLWNYKNIFLLDSWFHTILNYPENKHWVYVGIHTRRKIIFIVDSMWVCLNVTEILFTVKQYILSEYSSCPENQNLAPIGDFEDWSIKYKEQTPQQQDHNNCGVHSLLAFLSISFQSNSNTRIMMQWPVSNPACIVFRSLIQDLFFDMSRGPAMTRLKELLLTPLETTVKKRRNRG